MRKQISRDGKTSDITSAKSVDSASVGYTLKRTKLMKTPEVDVDSLLFKEAFYTDNKVDMKRLVAPDYSVMLIPRRIFDMFIFMAYSPGISNEDAEFLLKNYEKLHSISTTPDISLQHLSCLKGYPFSSMVLIPDKESIVLAYYDIPDYKGFPQMVKTALEILQAEEYAEFMEKSVNKSVLPMAFEKNPLVEEANEMENSIREQIGEKIGGDYEESRKSSSESRPSIFRNRREG